MAATEQKNVKDVGAGSIGALLGLSSGNKMVRQSPAAVIAGLGLGFVVTGALPGNDAHALIQAQVDAAELAGGGTVVLPYIGGYEISDTVTVSASNVHIILCDDVSLTKTTKASAFLFTVTNRTTRISNVGIHAVGGRWTIDANGRNVSDYPSYNTADTGYGAVLFKWCDEWRCEGLYGYNGLVATFRAFQCGYGRFYDCWASNSVWECGFIIDFNPLSTWDEDDQSSWSNAAVDTCRAWDCPGMFGIASYAATGVIIRDCLVWNCGNDTPTTYDYSGGGVSVETDILSSGQEARQRRCSVIRTQVFDCYNSGYFITATGTKMRDSDASGTIAPTNRSNAATDKGANVSVQGPGTLDERGGYFASAGTHGVILLGSVANATVFNPSGKIGGTVDGATLGHCIYGKGIAELDVLPSAFLKGSAAGMGIKVDNSGGATYNQGGGRAGLEPARVENCYDRAVNVSYVAQVYVAPSRIKDCRSGQGGTGAQVNVDNATRAMHGNIHNSDANAKTGSIMQIASSCTSGGGAGSVAGDFASSSAPVNNLATTKFQGYSQAVQPYSLAYGATITPNTHTMGQHISVGALTGNTTMAAAAGGPVAGERITLQFVQDGTGGKSITWNAAWKGATLTGSGTANQKARVTFEHDGSNFVQVASTGWYS